MKWLLYTLAGLVGLVVLAVVVLLALGGGRGQSRHVRSIEIARPADVVFVWITEPDRLKSWVGWLVDIRPASAALRQVGARAVWVLEDRNNNNQQMDVESEVTRLEPGRLLETRMTAAGGFTGSVSYELQPIDAQRTHLTYRATFHYEHWLAKLLEPLISRSAQQKLEEDLERLKQQVEAEPTAASE